MTSLNPSLSIVPSVHRTDDRDLLIDRHGHLKRGRIALAGLLVGALAFAGSGCSLLVAAGAGAGAGYVAGNAAAEDDDIDDD